MNVVGYLRVSTQAQASEDKFGLEVQKKMIMDYCKENNMEIIDWYEDHMSGNDDSRPALNGILFTGTNPPIEAVVVARNDRISRNTMDYYWFKKEFTKKDIKLISVSENFGSDELLAPAFEAISSAFAEIERKMIARRMTGGRAAKSRSGGYSGGQAPYGYYVHNGVLLVNEKQAECVRLIFKLHDRGYVTRAIAEKVNEQGYLNKSGKPFKHSSIAIILRNRKTYEGYYRYGGGEWVEGQHEAILDRKEE